MKAFMAFLLLVAIVGLTIFNYKRGQDKVEAGKAEVRQEATSEVASLTSLADSLTFELGTQQAAFGDSLVRKDNTYQQVIDSLDNAVEFRDKQIADLKQAAKARQKTASTTKKASTKPAVTDEAQKRHLEILGYYQDRFKSLPADLSEYERKVAVNEIRQETMQKFAITAVQLDRIRSDSKLSY